MAGCGDDGLDQDYETEQRQKFEREQLEDAQSALGSALDHVAMINADWHHGPMDFRRVRIAVLGEVVGEVVHVQKKQLR